MADIIRQDIIEIGFDADYQELIKLNKEIEELKKQLGGGVGDEEFDKLKDSMKDSTKESKKFHTKLKDLAKTSLDKLKNGLKGISTKLTDIGKRAAGAAFNGLKRLAGISFRALTIGLGATATAIGGLVKGAVSAYANYEQLFGGVETLLGAKGAKSVEEYAKMTGKSVDKAKGEYDKLMESQNLVMKNANNAYKTAGLSANAYMETVTGFSASLLQSVKGDTVEAAKLADMAISDMSDNANKMGTSMESIQYAYQGFAKQNYTMLDNLKLGYGGTKTEMARLVKDAAGMKDIQKELGITVDANSMSYGNIVKAIHIVQKKMDIMGTTEKEASQTITGSMNAMKAAWGNLLPALIQGGDQFDQCVDNLVESIVGKDGVGGVINNLKPAISKALSGAGRLIEELAPILEKEFPTLVDELLPPLIKAATSLLAGLIKALPSIVKSFAKEIPDILKEIGQAIVDTFGKEFPALKTFGESLMTNAQKIAKAVPYLIGAFVGFKVLKSVLPFVMGLFSKGSKGGGEKGGFLGNLGKDISELGKTKAGELAKGVANMAIIFGGFALLTGVFALIAPLLAELGDPKTTALMIAIIGELGLVSGALAYFAGIVGKVPVSTVAKGLANMAIMLAGMSALFLLVGAVSLIDFDLGRIAKITLIIGLLGTMGAVLSVFAGIVGLIPVPVVALGLANMAIIIAGMSALFLLIGATSLLKFDLARITKIIGIIALLGTVGATLSVFAGIVGMIPIPIVLAGLANIALVLGGMTALIVAFGKLSQVKGINEFISTGGELLANIFNVIGKIGGSLIGGLGEGISKSLPTIGENIGQFGKNISPLFDAIKGVDMGGVGAFFTSIVGLLGIATGKDIIDGIKSFFGGGEGEPPLVKLGTELTNFATNAQGFFKTIGAIPAESFPKATELFKSLAEIKNLPKADKKGNTAISAIANDLSTFNEKTSSFFTAVTGYDTEKVKALWESLKGANDISKDMSKKVNSDIDDIVSKITELPKKMGDALKQNSDALSDGMVQMWKDAVKASVAPVNKVIEAANWILKEFGSKKQALTWKPYASGTDGHKGGNALVNDGRGAELVQMPNGNTFIPNGRNVFLPNAPVGMKVLPAESTAQLMGKSSPTFNYADGTGKVDIWSFYDNGKGLVDAVTKNISYKGMSGFAKAVGQGMVSTFKGEMAAWVNKLFEEEGGKSLASYIPALGVGQWRSTVIRALKMEGHYSEANVKRTLYQMQTESGGNPRAINLWDKNAKNGTPSKGLMQVIDPTFRAYARSGFNKNIYDPLSNILASVRYATSRYGSLEKAYRGVGYSKGVGTVKMPTQASTVNLSYTPDGDSGYYSSSVESNTYAPQFVVHIHGTNDDRGTARKVKRWVKEAWDEVLSDMDSKYPQVQRV